MFGPVFFNSVAHRVDQWMGDLFVHKNVSPAELKNMDFAELKYWHGWFELEAAERKKSAQELDNAKGR
jgi:hypothetical protein